MVLGRARLQALAEEVANDLVAKGARVPSGFVKGRNAVLFLYPDGPHGQQNIFTMPLKEQQRGPVEPVIAMSEVDRVVQQETAGRRSSEALELLQERQRSRATGILQFIYDAVQDIACFAVQGSLFAIHNATHPEAPKRTLEPLRVSSGGNFEDAIDFKFCPHTSDLISFVKDGELYLYSRSAQTMVPLTNVGKEYGSSRVYAGTPSYIIQEEFDRYTGYWWQATDTSASHYRILYELVDERDVPRVSVSGMTFEDTPSDFTFPKPGQCNGAVTINVAEIPKALFRNGERKDAKLEVTTTTLGTQLKDRLPWAEYVVRCEWVPGRDEVWVQALQRVQQRLDVVVIPLSSFVPKEAAHDASASNGDSRSSNGDSSDVPWPTLVSEKSDVWINVHDVCWFVSCADGYRLLWGSEQTMFRHLYAISLTPDDKEPQRVALTSGEWMVNGLSMIKETDGSVFFTATKETPLQTHAYAMTIGGWSEWIATGAAPTPSDPVLMTKLGYSHHVDFLDDGMYVDIFSSSSEPPQCRFHRPDTDCFYFCEQQAPSMYVPPRIQTIKSKHGHDVHTFFFAARSVDTPPPPSSDPLPTLLFVYGGPHVQLVRDEYNTGRFALAQFLTLCGFNVVVADGRGSSNRGLAFEAPLHNAMGTFEADDQVEALQLLSQDASLRIDMDRIGVYGWSYGGYMSLMCLAQHPEVFKVAMAGAPVTDWRGYDTGYTERYMSLPSTHAKAYDAGSVLKRAADFPDEPGRLLLLHGLQDENVHFTHTASLINELTRFGKPYALQVFPRERHGVRSKHAKSRTWVEQAAFAQQALMQ
ncbi:hypothetical protein PTSG_10987 [Salpingoeca rosetta]|uniref:Uncharacterized protein n=1 Tax=Salpingoeca rosetta (strain ATCC 50818 / BSB-021) TaxID=946362 RepID=F2USD6_SALR5|nr:uncharacterized protein PTSG_10987 [Salpingoeca rosetta]EGD81045.1 hypothetical protein PTSG_10987 [Salpingoeca rosetta]|eukprot:XP_004987915.1 hypothetical protein PTSG_10987 [Salpingoeca rosetta]